MGNCLKTQLKESVQNNELLKIGYGKVLIEGEATVSVYYNGGVCQASDCIIVSGNPTITNESLAPGQTSNIRIVNNSGTAIIHMPKYFIYYISKNSGSGTVTVYGDNFIYNQSKINITITNVYLDGDWSKVTKASVLGNGSKRVFCKSRTTFNLSANPALTIFYCTGDAPLKIAVSGVLENLSAIYTTATSDEVIPIDYFLHTENISQLYVPNVHLSGNLSSLNSKLSLLKLGITNSTDIEGSFQTLVEAQCAAGRESGSMDFFLPSSKALNSYTQGKIIFNSTGCAVTTIWDSQVGSYNKSTGTWNWN